MHLGVENHGMHNLIWIDRFRLSVSVSLSVYDEYDKYDIYVYMERERKKEYVYTWEKGT